ncbi:protein draper-like [Haliotis rubra]|uniref:protein draper-like n=1 Tax=Haliotis rubra TaxID=36100 RepID=UPI001EE545C9|nr:protein draper-like [Haliotis rubra]
MVSLCMLAACPDGSYGINCTSRCGNCLDGDICDKTNGICRKGCAAGWMNDGTCLQRCAVGTHGINCTSDCGCEGQTSRDTCSEEGSTWGIPVAAVIGVFLICTVTGSTIYIRRLLKQLESLKTKVREEHYVALDAKTKTTATESTYEHIDNATPYYNTVNHLQDETG